MYNQKPLPGDLLDYGNWASRDLVGLWPFNEDNNSNKVFDLSENGLTGSLVATAHFVPGPFGPVIDLDGNSDFASIGDFPIFDFGTSDFALSIRVKRGRTTTREVIIGKDNTATGRQFVLLFVNDTVRFSFYVGGGAATLSTTATITDTLWHHIFAQRVGSTQEIYIDGILSASGGGSAGAMDATTGILRFGARESIPDYFLGQLDLPMIYGRSLSVSEIALLCREPFQMVRTKRKRIIYDGVEAAPPTTFPYYYREIASRRIA